MFSGSVEQMQMAAMKDKEEKHAKGMMDAQAVKVNNACFFCSLVSLIHLLCCFLTSTRLNCHALSYHFIQW